MSTSVVKKDEESQKTWNGPYYFVVGSDPQFGLIARYIEKKTEPNWEKEVKQAEQCVKAINELNPKPRFFAICGDLVDAYPDAKSAEIRKEQVKVFYDIFSKVDNNIPLVKVCGNHDVGETPTEDAVQNYRSSFGEDYYSFWNGGVLYIVINSQYLVGGTHIPNLVKNQNSWLDTQLKQSKSSKIGAIVFQHVPPFIKDPEDTKKDYFCLEHDVRKQLLNKYNDAGVRYVFCGHLHYNANGKYKNIECITTSAIGGQLGNDQPGARIVKVYEDRVEHEYYTFDSFPKEVKL